MGQRNVGAFTRINTFDGVVYTVNGILINKSAENL